MNEPNLTTQIVTTLGLLVAIVAVGRVGVLFLIDGYYDALERVRRREAALPRNDQPDLEAFNH